MAGKNKNKKYVLALIPVLIILGVFVFYFAGKIEISPLAGEKANIPNVANRPAETIAEQKILFAVNGSGENAYKIERNGKWCVIFKGTEGPCYDSVSNPVFSPDGTQFAYVAEKDGQWVVVLSDNTETLAYDGVSSIVFSPDGTSVAIVAEKEENELVIVDGKEGKEYADISTLETWSGTDGQVVFNPDSDEVAYKVEEGDQEMVVINGEEGKKYDEIGNFDFSEEGDQFAYEAETGGEEVTVIDGQETADSNTPAVPPSSPSAPGSSNDSSVSSGNVNNGSKPRFTVCEKNMATGEECNF